jgi:hypothetical protein
MVIFFLDFMSAVAGITSEQARERTTTGRMNIFGSKDLDMAERF